MASPCNRFLWDTDPIRGFSKFFVQGTYGGMVVCKVHVQNTKPSMRISALCKHNRALGGTYRKTYVAISSGDHSPFYFARL